ncbi:29396_t:CDS:2 [Gigaspora margarita]|uniref:29396_t:CDS:1 n=1 Tax=Gigaspora margarita TaxID=4874 RepID=A0ABN7V4K2_GIGMA|nr:29396_t:CDS:2 [Gigaspora margarita]
MDEETQKIAEQISYTKNIANPKIHYTNNQKMEIAILQTKDKESVENANISNKPQTKTKLSNNIELEVIV